MIISQHVLQQEVFKEQWNFLRDLCCRQIDRVPIHQTLETRSSGPGYSTMLGPWR